MNNFPRKSVLAVVAHPDDESLWAGGLLLAHPEWDCTVVTLCRGSDPDRRPRFQRAMEVLGAHGIMGDVDDGPEQRPLPGGSVCASLQSLIPDRRFHRVLTHDPRGEYTRHRRHEEVASAVIRLWTAGPLAARSLWTFAYTDRGGRGLPVADPGAPFEYALPPALWARKYDLISHVYGFAKESFEARATPRVEAFRCFTTPLEALRWMHAREPRETPA